MKCDSHTRTSPKNFGGAMKFCPNFVTFAQIMILEYISDMKKNCLSFSDKNQFCPKIMVISKKKKKKKKKRSSPKFGYYFLQFVIITSLNFLTLPKFFISLPEKLWFCPNIFFSLPEKS